MPAERETSIPPHTMHNDTSRPFDSGNPAQLHVKTINYR